VRRLLHDIDVYATGINARLRASPSPAQRWTRNDVSALNALRGQFLERLDRDLDGRIDDPGAAIIDAAWPRIADAVMGTVLGPQLNELATLVPRCDQPPGGQAEGWHSSCRTALWAALDAAGTSSPPPGARTARHGGPTRTRSASRSCPAC
jgi:hypothetical protein